MPLESASYIDGLDSANPAATDQISQGDDHLRLIKSVLKATFPNITGPVTQTQDELNALGGLPVGVIAMWYGSSGSIPTGWAICDGTDADLSDGSGTITTPDLRNKIVMGAGTTVAQGSTAGSLTDAITTSSDGGHTHNVTGTHTHTISGLSGSTDGTALTVAQMPAHKHGNGICDNLSSHYNHGTLAASPSTSRVIDGSSGTGSLEGYTTQEGTGDTHSHTLTGLTGTTAGPSGGEATDSAGAHTHTATVDTLPPVYGLHYIMKV